MYGAVLLLVFIAIVLGGGTLIGLATRPGEWYASLAKPAFNPPSWTFAPVWTVIYVLVAIAGWLTFMHGGFSAAMLVWAGQLVLNFSWSPTFFGAHRPGLALIVVIALLVLIISFIALQWESDLISATLFLPYAAWVAFATLLNTAIWRLNRGKHSV